MSHQISAVQSANIVFRAHAAGRDIFAKSGEEQGKAIKRFMASIKRAKSVGDARYFPKFKPGMSTKEYVRQYEALNDRNFARGFYELEDLNTAPATLYEGGSIDFAPELFEVEEADDVTAAAPEVVEVEQLPAADDAEESTSEAVALPAAVVEFEALQTTADEVRAWGDETVAAVFDALEEVNMHSEAAVLMAMRKGTAADVDEARAILREHIARGYLAADLADRAAALRARLRGETAPALEQDPAEIDAARRAFIAPAAAGPANRVASRTADAVAYLFTSATTGKPRAGGFVGTSTEPAEWHVFDDAAARRAWLSEWFASLSPVAAPAGSLSIVLTRAEGPADSCGHPVAVASFAAADDLLRAWSETAPARGGYDKCDVTITWPDGETYAGRFDLKHSSCGAQSLAADMVETVAFYLGDACPEHMTGAQYAGYLQQLGDDNRAAYERIREQLRAAGAWRDIARPQVVDLGAFVRAAEIPLERLVGFGVVFTGYRDACNDSPRGVGAIVSAEQTQFGLRLCVRLEDGRELHPDIDTDFRDGARRPAMYRVDGRMHGAPYLAQLEGARAAQVAAASSAKEMQARRFAAEVERLAAEHPDLERAGEDRDSLTTAARNLRKLLRAAWPGVKFSVRVERFSGGDSMDVSWTDGPTPAEVDAIADRFAAGSFDGMTDSYSYSRTPWNKLFGDAKYVHSRRELSDAAVAAVIAQEWAGIDDAPTVEDYRRGRIPDDGGSRIYRAGRQWSAPAAPAPARRARAAS